MKKITTLIMALCVVSLVSCSPRGSGKSPSKTVSDYLTCLVEGKYQKSVEFLDHEDSEELSAFAYKMEEAMKEQGGLKNFKLVDGGETISEDGLTANVATVLNYGDGQSDEIVWPLKKVDGQWKIDLSVK